MLAGFKDWSYDVLTLSFPKNICAIDIERQVQQQRDYEKY